MHVSTGPDRCAILLSVLLASGCSGFKSEAAAPDHDIEVVAAHIQLADGLGFHPSGALLATQEYRGGGLVRIDPQSGLFTYVVRDLADPDNLAITGSTIYVTEEDTQGRIIEIDSMGRISTFADGLDGPEGLDLGPDGKLYVVEHAPNGRIYRYSLAGRRETLGRASNGEGLRVLPDGSIVIAETSEQRLLRLFPDGTRRYLAARELEAPDGVAYDPVQQRLLVTEDAAPGRMLQVDLESGALHTVATGLNKPQTMLFEADGSILVAEQGEDRILRLRPKQEAQ
ncbi:MAG TPA: hypothetical protein VI072_34795 [Polyangiaceae bacterium]